MQSLAAIAKKRQAAKLRLESFLRDLYIIVHPSLREAGIALEWCVAADLPDVWADHHSLLQVFKEIGARMELTESSVKAVLQRLFEKAGVRSRSQLVRYAIEAQIAKVFEL